MIDVSFCTKQIERDYKGVPHVFNFKVWITSESDVGDYLYPGFSDTEITDAEIISAERYNEETDDWEDLYPDAHEVLRELGLDVNDFIG